MNVPSAMTTLHDAVTGNLPALWHGTSVVNGNAYPWLNAAIGSMYFSPTGTYQKTTSGWSLIDSGGAVNVLGYGADPTGVTGSGAAINAALAAASADKYQRVYIPAGKYLIDETIIVDSLIHLQGDGRATYLVAAADLGGPVIKSYFESGVRWSYMQIISDMRIDGNRENQTTATGCYGIHLDSPETVATAPTRVDELIGAQRAVGVLDGQWSDSNRILRNLFVEYSGDTGIYMEGRGGIHLDSVVTWECGGYGFRSTYDTTYVNCEAARNNKAGFFTDQASVRYVACKSWWSGYKGYLDVWDDNEVLGYGWHIKSDYGVTITGCEAQDNYNSGYYFEGAYNVICSGCVADSNNKRDGDGTGIDFWDSHNVRWEGTILDRYNDDTRYQDYAVRYRQNSTQNVVKFTHRYYNGGASTSSQQIISHIDPSSTFINNNTTIINNYEGWQSAGGVSSISPSPYFGKRCHVNIDQNMTISHVSGQAHEYVEMEYVILQDGTGGWAITWSSDFDLGGTPPTFTTTANTYTTIRFVWNSDKWRMVSFQTGV